MKSLRNIFLNCFSQISYLVISFPLRFNRVARDVRALVFTVRRRKQQPYFRGVVIRVMALLCSLLELCGIAELAEWLLRLSSPSRNLSLHEYAAASLVFGKSIPWKRVEVLSGGTLGVFFKLFGKEVRKRTLL